jgi:porin
MFKTPFYLSLLTCSLFFSSHLRSEESSSQATSPAEDPLLGISTNPAAVNISTGTGALGRSLGIKDSTGIKLGGVWVADGDVIFTGGAHDGKRWSGNNLFILSLTADMQKMHLWKGGLFGVEFLQFNGMDTNGYAGSVQGYDSLPGPPPLNRSELYQLWFRQAFFNNKFIVRIGKMVPTYDFNNVLRPVPMHDSAHNIPSVSGLLYTPIFVNPTLLGVMPGYYNSAYGVLASLAPVRNFYLTAAAYDGNLARGKQTGLRGPHFNGYYFYIAEMGGAWELGQEAKPGSVGIGAWHQTGKLSIPGTEQDGTQGIYAFGSQRLWFRHPGVDHSGISGFFQLGINNSKTMPMQKYVGLGLTAFALTRPQDSMGIGMAWSWLNHRLFERKSELMFQAYYQAHLFLSAFLEPAITYIPKPGASKDISQTWTGTLQLIFLF